MNRPITLYQYLSDFDSKTHRLKIVDEKNYPKEFDFSFSVFLKDNYSGDITTFSEKNKVYIDKMILKADELFGAENKPVTEEIEENG